MYKLPDLPYAYDALEPYVDKRTMTIHHTKHHQKYVDNLNTFLFDVSFPETTIGNLLMIIKKRKDIEAGLKERLNFNGGSHYNHTMYWHCMSMEPAHKEMMAPLHDQIVKDFGSAENLRKEFLTQCMTMLGIGWQWLCYDKSEKRLKLCTTYQQDNPLIVSDNLAPVLACDLWEHAYYLQFNADKKTFLEGWYQVINWENVSLFFDMVRDDRVIDFMHDGKVNLFTSSD